MAYKSVFFALSLAYTILSPVVNMFLPLKKEIILFNDPSELDKVNTKNQYPILDFIGLVQLHQGYVAEEHTVKTSDGYILKVHRISGGPSNPPAAGKPVAYLQHGLLQSSDSFVLIGPDSDLAFQLVNAGYDVWLGNGRGNTYSRSHVSKSPKYEDFWDFSFHEIGLYDLPATIDRILEITGVKDLTYYGFSMGTTVSYVMLSMRPEYNEKVNLLYSLAPVAYWQYDLRKTMKGVDIASNMIKEYFVYFSANELLPQNALTAYMGTKFCDKANFIIQPICALITCTLFSLDFGRFNKTALPTILAHNPAGTSRMVLLHLHKNIEKGVFEPYDYGESKNLKKYGQSNIPYYNLTNIRAPVILWYGQGDDVVNYKDAMDLEQKLPNVLSSNLVAYEKFNHIDFLWAPDAKNLVYNNIIRKL